MIFFHVSQRVFCPAKYGLNSETLKRIENMAIFQLEWYALLHTSSAFVISGSLPVSRLQFLGSLILSASEILTPNW